MWIINIEIRLLDFFSNYPRFYFDGNDSTSLLPTSQNEVSVTLLRILLYLELLYHQVPLKQKFMYRYFPRTFRNFTPIRTIVPPLWWESRPLYFILLIITVPSVPIRSLRAFPNSILLSYSHGSSNYPFYSTRNYFSIPFRWKFVYRYQFRSHKKDSTDLYEFHAKVAIFWKRNARCFSVLSSKARVVPCHLQLPAAPSCTVMHRADVYLYASEKRLPCLFQEHVPKGSRARVRSARTRFHYNGSCRWRRWRSRPEGSGEGG